MTVVALNRNFRQETGLTLQQSLTGDGIHVGGGDNGYFASAKPQLPIHPSPTPAPPALGNHKSVLYVCESVSVS